MKRSQMRWLCIWFGGGTAQVTLTEVCLPDDQGVTQVSPQECQMKGPGRGILMRVSDCWSDLGQLWTPHCTTIIALCKWHWRVFPLTHQTNPLMTSRTELAPPASLLPTPQWKQHPWQWLKCIQAKKQIVFPSPAGQDWNEIFFMMCWKTKNLGWCLFSAGRTWTEVPFWYSLLRWGLFLSLPIILWAVKKSSWWTYMSRDTAGEVEGLCKKGLVLARTDKILIMSASDWLRCSCQGAPMYSCPVWVAVFSIVFWNLHKDSLQCVTDVMLQSKK